MIFGTPENLSQWDCPCDSTWHELGVKCLDNTKTQKIVNGINLFLDLCLVDKIERLKWKHCISEYQNAMLLLKRCNLMNDEIK